MVHLQQLKRDAAFKLRYVKGVPFVTRGYTKGVPFLSKMVHTKGKGLVPGAEPLWWVLFSLVWTHNYHKIHITVPPNKGKQNLHLGYNKIKPQHSHLLWNNWHLEDQGMIDVPGTLGNSRKYPYPTTDGFHVLTPPCLRKFQNALPPQALRIP